MILYDPQPVRTFEGIYQGMLWSLQFRLCHLVRSQLHFLFFHQSAYFPFFVWITLWQSPGSFFIPKLFRLWLSRPKNIVWSINVCLRLSLVESPPCLLVSIVMLCFAAHTLVIEPILCSFFYPYPNIKDRFINNYRCPISCSWNIACCGTLNARGRSFKTNLHHCLPL